MNILVVAGHPADMFDHCGGTLYHHIKRGDKVTCVSMTQGLRVHDEVIQDVFRTDIGKYSEEEIQKLLVERQKVKYAEVIKACGMFGIEDVRFLDYSEEILTMNTEMISKLARLMREIQPDILITHWPRQFGGISNHHAIVGQIALAAATAAAGVNFEDKMPACRLVNTFFMLSPADCSSFDLLSNEHIAHASFYVDVSDVIDIKVKALNSMRSQKYDFANHAKRMAEQWYGTFGRRACLAYAEGFAMLEPEVGQYLPVSEYKIFAAKADEREITRKTCTLAAMKVDLEERE